MRMLLLLLSAAVSSHTASSPDRLNAAAVEHFKQARYQDAEAGFRGAWQGWSHAGPQCARDHALAGMNLGTVLRIEGRFAEAETVLTQSRKNWKLISGQDSPDAARAATALAILYQTWGRPLQAEPLAQSAAQSFEHDPAATDSDRANSVILLASVYVEERRFSSAEALLDDLLHRGESPLTFRAYNDLAVAALRLDDLPRAESLVRRALDMAPRVLPGPAAARGRGPEQPGADLPLSGALRRSRAALS